MSVCCRTQARVVEWVSLRHDISLASKSCLGLVVYKCAFDTASHAYRDDECDAAPSSSSLEGPALHRNIWLTIKKVSSLDRSTTKVFVIECSSVFTGGVRSLASVSTMMHRDLLRSANHSTTLESSTGLQTIEVSPCRLPP